MSGPFARADAEAGKKSRLYLLFLRHTLRLQYQSEHHPTGKRRGRLGSMPIDLRGRGDRAGRGNYHSCGDVRGEGRRPASAWRSDKRREPK